MEECPFCGAGVEVIVNGAIKFTCGTSFDPNYCIELKFVTDHERYGRSETCYERQLAQLQAKVEGMKEVLKSAARLANNAICPECKVIPKVQDHLGHCSISKAQTLLAPAAGEFVAMRREDLKKIQESADRIFDDDKHDLRLTKQEALNISETVLKVTLGGEE